MEGLTNFIAISYGLSPILKWERVARGYSTVNYFIHTDSHSFFLREHPQEDLEEIEKIYHIEHFFAGAGIPLPLPLTTVEGTYYVVNLDKIYSLFPFVSGRHPQIESVQKGTPELFSFSQTLARIHLAGQHETSLTTTSVGTWKRESFLRDASLIETHITSKATLDEFDHRTLASLQLRRRLIDEYSQPYSHFGLVNDHLIHGDYYLDNVLFEANGAIAAVLDWDSSVMAPRSLELARSTLYTFFIDQVPTIQTHEAAKTHIATYNEYYPISRKEVILGLQAQFSLLIHRLWIEKAHYFKQEGRLDYLLAPRTTALEYMAKNFHDITQELSQGLVN